MNKSHLAIAAALAAAAAGAAPAMASAASTCTYDPASKVATVVTDDSGGNRLVLASNNGYITVDRNRLCVSPGFDFATPTNTDQIVVNAVLTGTSDGVTVDESGGPLGPGASPEADNHPEIETAVRVAPGFYTRPVLEVIGSAGNDVYRVGGLGRINLNNDDDTDLAVVGTPASVLLYGGNGDDFLSGFGYGNLLDSTVSVSIGGDDGDDRLFGSHKQDFLNGGRGNDSFRTEGDPGNQDLLVGGDGFDSGILDPSDKTDGLIESVGISG